MIYQVFALFAAESLLIYRMIQVRSNYTNPLQIDTGNHIIETLEGVDFHFLQITLLAITMQTIVSTEKALFCPNTQKVNVLIYNMSLLGIICN